MDAVDPPAATGVCSPVPVGVDGECGGAVVGVGFAVREELAAGGCDVVDASVVGADAVI